MVIDTRLGTSDHCFVIVCFVLSSLCTLKSTVFLKYHTNWDSVSRAVRSSTWSTILKSSCTFCITVHQCGVLLPLHSLNYWTVQSVVQVFYLGAILIIIIVIIKKGWQCKAGRERLTPYQSKDPSPTIPTHRMKNEKEKSVGDKKLSEQQLKANNKALALLLKPASPTALNM